LQTKNPEPILPQGAGVLPDAGIPEGREPPFDTPEGAAGEIGWPEPRDAVFRAGGRHDRENAEAADRTIC
jgi:hypothetical protein